MPHLPWPLYTLLATALAVVLHYLVWGRVYRIRADSDALLTAICADGWKLTVAHYLPAEPSARPPVILCHGLSANRWNMCLPGPNSVAGFLKARGHACFVVDLRGCGDSGKPPPGKGANDWNFDDHVRQDAPAVLELALKTSGAPRALWVGHSMGGLIGLALAQSAHAEQLAGVVALGSPTRWQHHRRILGNLIHLGERLAWSGRIHNRWGARLFAPYLGRLPLPLAGVATNFKNMEWTTLRQVVYQVIADSSRKMLAEFGSWFTRNVWELGGNPPVDLRAGLATIRCPVLLIGGTLDALAPPQAMKDALQDLGAADKSLLLFGKPRGDAQDYGHGDLVFGARAATEVFPEVERWLSAHAGIPASAS